MEKEKLLEIFSNQPKFHKISSGQYKCCCPAHADKNPSLSINFIEDRALIYDFAGCRAEDICKNLGIEFKDLFFDNNYKNNANKIEYRFYDEQGNYKYSKLRIIDEKGKKKIFFAVNTGINYEYKNVPKERYLYNLPQLKIAIENECNTIYIVEGEKDVNTLTKLGMLATTSGGSTSWEEKFSKYFEGLNVIILRDNDQSGLEYANAIVKSIYNICARYKVIVTSQQEKGDVTNYIEEGHSKEDLLKLIEKVPFIQKGVIDKDLIATAQIIDSLDKTEFKFFSVKELFNMKLDPIQWAVKDLIPQGLSILASPPKYGKSWMCLDLCLSIASGKPFLEFETVKGTCLYLALEDSLVRLKQRLEIVLKENQVPDNFFMLTKSPTINSGLIEILQNFVNYKRDTRLIIIDTFQKVRDGMNKYETLYQGDYKDIGILKKFADDYKIAVVLIHHLRKMDDISDQFNRVYGSNGITGAADTVIVLSRSKRTAENTVMYVTGRDLEEKEIVLSFDKASCKWKILGDIVKVEYENSPIVQFLKTKIGYEGKNKDLVEEYNKYSDVIINSRTFKAELTKFIPQLKNNGIKINRFRRNNGWFISIKKL